MENVGQEVMRGKVRNLQEKKTPHHWGRWCISTTRRRGDKDIEKDVTSGGAEGIGKKEKKSCKKRMTRDGQEGGPPLGLVKKDEGEGGN